MPVLWRRDAAGELEDAGPSALKIVLEDGSLALPKFGEPLRPQMPTRPVPQGGGLAPPTGGGGLAPPPTVAGGLAPPPPPPTVPLAAGSLAIPRPVGVGGGLAAPPLFAGAAPGGGLAAPPLFAGAAPPTAACRPSKSVPARKPQPPPPPPQTPRPQGLQGPPPPPPKPPSPPSQLALTDGGLAPQPTWRRRPSAPLGADLAKFFGDRLPFQLGKPTINRANRAGRHGMWLGVNFGSISAGSASFEAPDLDCHITLMWSQKGSPMLRLLDKRIEELRNRLPCGALQL